MKHQNLENTAARAKAFKEKRKELRASNAQTKFATSLAESRKQKWHEERCARREADDDLARMQKVHEATEELMQGYKRLAEESQSTKRRMKTEWESAAAARSKGGRQKWPLWVVQLICELLVNGTTPTAVPANIQSMYQTLYGKGANEWPSVNFVRECRATVEVMGETICAIKLGRAKTWGQLWTDATTRRQLPFTALIIGLLGDGVDNTIDPVVVSSCIFMQDETAETQAEGIIDRVSCVSAYCIYGLRC